MASLMLWYPSRAELSSMGNPALALLSYPVITESHAWDPGCEVDGDEEAWADTSMLFYPLCSLS